MSRTLGAGCLLALAALTACGREEGIRTYRAPKDPTWRMIAALVPAGGETWFFKVAGLTADLAPHKAELDTFLGGLKVEGAAVTWTVPPGWTAAGSGGDRQTTLVFGKGLELAVSRLPGAAGGVLANVNRWRSQMGQGPVSEAELPSHTRTIDVSGGKATVVDLEGPKRPSGPPMAAARAPEERRERDPKAQRETVRSLFTFEKPSSWVENPDPSQRDRVYEWRAGEGAGAPLVTLTVFPGDVGGVAANVNRWRGQAGLAELDADAAERDAKPIGFLDAEGRLAECLGPERGILAAFRLSDISVFLKMDGDRAAVEGQRSTFEAFARTMKFGSAK